MGKTNKIYLINAIIYILNISFIFGPSLLDVKDSFKLPILNLLNNELSNEEIINKIKENTSNDLKYHEEKNIFSDLPISYKSFFDHYDESVLREALNIISPFLSNFDNKNNIMKVKLMVSDKPHDLIDSRGIFDSGSYAVVIATDVDASEIVSIVAHELFHSLQYDILPGKYKFPVFLAEASASSYYPYSENKTFNYYEEIQLFEKLFILNIISNDYSIEDYYNVMFNNEYNEFLELMNITDKNKFEEILNTTNNYLLSSYNVEEKTEYNYENVLYFYKKILNNLVSSNKDYFETLLIYSYLNIVCFNILEDNINESIKNQYLEVSSQFYNNIKNKFIFDEETYSTDLNLAYNTVFESNYNVIFNTIDHKQEELFFDYPFLKLVIPTKYITVYSEIESSGLYYKVRSDK